ncbi:hypothetical protein HY251_01890 [bacterium]|nr:hypothetical protein [bacterium]
MTEDGSSDPDQDADESGEDSWDEDDDGSSPEPEPGEGEPQELRAFAVDLIPPKLGVQALVRVFVFAAVLAGAIALLSFEHREQLLFELTALGALASGALIMPARAVARRLERYPDRGRVRFDRRGFRLPWLGADAPGPEGPWEALRGFRVRERKGGAPRLLILDLASGRFALSDNALGAKTFDLALSVLERALGPGGVLLGTVVRLPVQPHDPRRFLARKMPILSTVAIAFAFTGFGLGVAANGFVKVAAIVFAFLSVATMAIVQTWDQPPAADLVLGLDGLVVPLLPDLRCSVKLPLSALKRSTIARASREQGWLVIEHEGGTIQYPLSWLDARKAGEFARQLDRARD